MTRDLLIEYGVKNVTVQRLLEQFQELSTEKKWSRKYHKMLEEVLQAKKEYDRGKLTKQEMNKVRREAREYIRVVMDLLDWKRAQLLSKAKIQFHYGVKVGEVMVLPEVAFLIKDVAKRDDY